MDNTQLPVRMSAFVIVARIEQHDRPKELRELRFLWVDDENQLHWTTQLCRASMSSCFYSATGQLEEITNYNFPMLTQMKVMSIYIAEIKMEVPPGCLQPTQ